MNIVELIRTKREKGALTPEEIKYLISEYTSGNVMDYQFSAFLMAAFLNGMDKNETAALTESMLYSGEVIDLSMIPGTKVDKHSTGGVGDKTSLILAPVVAAAGVNVPMISGRGLGHTGGTLDKLESIPGFNTGLDLDNYKRVIAECGAVLIGQTKEIAPADKLIYSLRDVTATVESIPLITASIMSKKLAEGIDGLVLDVKTGTGAFMSEYDDSVELAQSLINTAKAFDKKVIAYITDMNQPLGRYIGNWFEVYESVKVLKGEQVPDLWEVSVKLSGAMIYLGGKAESVEAGEELAIELIKNGKALEKFIEIVEIQGGDVNVIKNPESYPKAKYTETVTIDNEGYVAFIDNYQIGMAALELGAGRKTKEDSIDPLAGIIFNKRLGDKVNKGDVLAELHTNDEKSLELAKQKINKAVSYSPIPIEPPVLIKEVLK